MNNELKPNELQTFDNSDSCCANSEECCTPTTQQLSRRNFLGSVSLAAAGGSALLSNSQVMAGPFKGDDSGENPYTKLIPKDKKLDSKWVQSLYERGTKDVYTDVESLKNIGMPVGGLFAGTVYLSGDGRLWLWDVFNRDQEGIDPRPMKSKIPNGGSPLVGLMARAGLNYIEPAESKSPFTLDFSLTVNGKKRTLDSEGFSKVTFDGRYPMGRVSYQDEGCPLTVKLEAFSPFIPLNADDSSLPVTLMSYTLKNPSSQTVKASLAGRIENPVCLNSKNSLLGRWINRVIQQKGFTSIECLAQALPKAPTKNRKEIVFEDFESEKFTKWKVEGKAFGDGPVAIKDIPDYQGDVNGAGKRVVNSHATAPGESIPEKDGHKGKLTSDEFKISRKYIRLRLGGGSHQGRTCVNLVIDGKVVSSLSGRSNNRMSLRSMDTRKHEGKFAHLEIIDDVSGPWGNVGVDEIVFTDEQIVERKIEDQRDFGTMSLALLSSDQKQIEAAADLNKGPLLESTTDDSEAKLIGGVRKSIVLKPNEEITVTWAVSWHFPNLRVRSMPSANVGNYYASRFKSSQDVLKYVVSNYSTLSEATRSWVNTWYDSTLPYWLLDRSMANTSILATTTCYRFNDGRFWAWEGVGCCYGTCTHVWHYAQAVARIFPEVERDQRERVDFKLAFHPDGGIGHRSGLNNSVHPAVDGQCGRILGAYREHLMSKDDTFLKGLWPNVKKSIEWLINFDKNSDGVLEGAQHNTLDAAWFGKIPWLISLYLAVLRAGAEMADRMGDSNFKDRCEEIAERGKKEIVKLWNGEYFIQVEDPKHPNAIGTGTGCHIDQVFGQSWAHWVGLGDLFDREKQLSALRSLWNYNFTPDIGTFRKNFPRGRWYAMEGDAGLLMCTWPKGGQDKNHKKHWQYGYFNECMTGFEWQVASHMIWEGRDQKDLLESGLAISRAIHDRYKAQLRNPYNEIECSDHYSRAMASYGVYQAVCGFECDGPQGALRFAPRISPENFRAAYIAPESWGTFEQKLNGKILNVKLVNEYGNLNLQELSVSLSNSKLKIAKVLSSTRKISSWKQDNDKFIFHLDSKASIKKNETFEIQVLLS